MRSIFMIGFLLPFIPMLLVSGIIFYQFESAHKNHLRFHLADDVLKSKQTIDHYLEDKLEDLGLIVRFFSYEDLQKPTVLGSILKELQARQDTFYESLRLLDSRGREIVVTGSETPSRAFHGESGWFKEVLEAGHVISEISIKNEDFPEIVLAVRGGNQEAPWVLSSTISNVALDDKVQSLGIGTEGSTFIFSRNGKCLIKPESYNNPIKSEFEDFLGLVGKADEVVVVRRRDEIGKENVFFTTFLNSADWVFVLRQGASELFSGLHGAKKVTGVTVLVAGIFISFYALGLSRKTVRRIEEANRKQEKVNKQMLQTSKLASIGELAAGIAHEINNPVAIIVEEAGWIEDLLEDEDLRQFKNIGEFERALKQIHSQGQRCKEITHKLLSFARKTDFKLQKVNLNELINDIMAISSRHSKYNRVKIKVDIQEDLPEFMLPPTELQQMLLNLVNNAIDAVEEDDGSILVTAEMEGTNIVIRVSDNGPGISKEDLPRVFDPFFTTKPVGKGTGLGLSICYGIAERMGGEIHVKSAPESGTTFRVTIPAATSEEASFRNNSGEIIGIHQHVNPANGMG